MEAENIEPILGRESPTDADVAAIQLGVRRFGIVGLVNRTHSSWCVTAAAGFGCAVKAEALHALRQALAELRLYAA